MNDKKIDFVKLATYCQNRYKDSLVSPKEKYIMTLFVSIKNDTEIKKSTTPHILENADSCILIHQRSELAYQNWYVWYYVEYINAEGAVFNNNFGDDLTVSVIANGPTDNQCMTISDKKNTYCRIKWGPKEYPIEKIWYLYCSLRRVSSPSRRMLIANLFEKEEIILQLKEDIQDLHFSNKLLEQERDQYKGLLDEIQNLVRNR